MYGVLHDDVTDRALARYGYCVNDEWFQSETPPFVIGMREWN